MKKLLFVFCFFVSATLVAQVVPNGKAYTFNATQNPIISHKHTADPAPFVKGDTLYLYTGVDHAGNQNVNTM